MKIPENAMRAAAVKDEITSQLIADGALERVISAAMAEVKGQYDGPKDEPGASALLLAKAAGIALARSVTFGMEKGGSDFTIAVALGITLQTPRLGEIAKRHFCIEMVEISKTRFGIDLDVKEAKRGHL